MLLYCTLGLLYIYSIVKSTLKLNLVKCKDIAFKYDFGKSESYSSTWVKVLKYLIVNVL